MMYRDATIARPYIQNEIIMTFWLRTLRLALGALAFAATELPWAAADALAQGSNVLNPEIVLRDPEIPPLGNLNGDVTFVEYFDYHCPYCKAVAPELEKLGIRCHR